MLRKARLHKRKRNYGEAVSLWEATLGCRGFSAEPYEELAKIYEHRFADLDKALGYTERALEQVALLQAMYPERLPPDIKENLVDRLQRLKRKKKRAGVCHK
jgi:hypothetical protein